MAVSSIQSLTKLRLTGLSSGMDTDTIIKSMMQIEQLKINRQYRARTTLQWRQEALNSVKSDLTTFKNDFISVLGSKSMMKEAAYNTFKAEVTGKNANAVTVSATTNAKAGSVTIDNIYSLAAGASATSTSTNKTTVRASYIYKELAEGDLGPNSDMTLNELNSYLKTKLTFAEETVTDPDTGLESISKYIAFSINGEDFKFTSDTTLRQMTQQITDSDAGVTARIDWTTDGFYFTSNTGGENMEIKNIAGNAFKGAADGRNGAFGYEGIRFSTTTGVSAGRNLSNSITGKTASETALKDLNLAQPLVFQNGQILFSINGKMFSFKETDTLGHMMNTISSDSTANAEMTYSELTDTFSIKSKNLGVMSSLSIVNYAGNAFEGGGRSAFGISAGTFYNGSNAAVKINGTVVLRDSNDFTIDGIKYTLNKVTQEGDEPIEVTLTRDIEPALTSIKEFVTGYNTMIEKLQNMLTERKTNDEKDYVPLTDEEKSEMTEKQIEEWEAIAKKGILKNNAGIQSLLSRLRGALFETVNSVGITPADIGLKTDEYKAGNMGGAIALDEEKLRAALEKDPNGVMRLFTDLSTSEDRSVEYKESGLIMRMSMIFDDYTKGASEIALDSIESSLKQVSNKITEMLEKMAAKEEKLYAQYAAMETALSKIQSQSDWLTSMLGSTGSK